jgi:AAA domain
MLRHSLCPHVVILPESAGIVLGGGFPRGDTPTVRRAAQRAIFHVQRELESTTDGGNAALVLCDRGMIDGVGYWPGPDDFWASVGTSREEILRRYDAVIHLRTPDGKHGYGHQNPLRVETDREASAIDGRILQAWEGHPRRFVIPVTSDFVAKARRVLGIVRDEVPECCRGHVNGLVADPADQLPA